MMAKTVTETNMKHDAARTESMSPGGGGVDLGLSMIGFGALPRSQSDSPVSSTHTDTHQAVCGLSVWQGE